MPGCRSSRDRVDWIVRACFVARAVSCADSSPLAWLAVLGIAAGCWSLCPGYERAARFVRLRLVRGYHRASRGSGCEPFSSHAPLDVVAVITRNYRGKV